MTLTNGPALAGQAATEAQAARIARIISDYAGQGNHRTGTAVDELSAVWLEQQISAHGVTPLRDSFPFQRLEVHRAQLLAGDLQLPGVPLYDCHYTDAAGISGHLGELGSAAEIGVAMASPFGAGPGHEAIEVARRANRHKAIVLVTDQRLPAGGVATLNAEAFTEPYGPPVLQVAHDQWPALQLALQAGTTARLIAHCEYVAAEAINVQAKIAGTDATLAPLVVMTPRSGWWQCASERGGGIAALLEIMAALQVHKPARDVLFTLNSGHELGHTGLDYFLDKQPELVRDAYLWLHLGANFAASQGAAVRLQYSDAALQSMFAGILGTLVAANETPIGTRPDGEARNIFDGGGRFVSILGGNQLFHHPADRWPEAVDLQTSQRWVAALVQLSLGVAGKSAG